MELLINDVLSASLTVDTLLRSLSVEEVTTGEMMTFVE
jgi:hypothetical protein